MWAYDFKAQKRIARRVKHLIPGETKKWVHLLTSEGEIITTPGHDFWVESLGDWVDAQELLPEMELRTSEGKITYLISLHIEELDSVEATYNFEVEENHNYYVGQEGVLVHNIECKLPRFDGPKPTYHINDAHVPGKPGFNPRKTPLPKDAQEVYKTAVPGKSVNPRAWFGKNKDGQIYRFSDSNDGTAHFSGIEGVGDGIGNLKQYARGRLNEL